MDREQPNPYRDAPLGELYEAAMRRAGELRAPSTAPRTREERAALASDTGNLLIALAGCIGSGSPHVPGSPERDVELRGASFVAAFGHYLEHRNKETRYATLLRASNVALGGQARNWIRDGWVDGERVYDLAMGSDAGLRRVLEHLGALVPRR